MQANIINDIVVICRNYPQIVIFLSLGLGYLIGKIKIKGFSLGSTTSVLLVAIALGQMDIPVSELIMSVSFGLFIFGIGYKVGPQFFGAMKSGGLNYLWIALIVAVGSVAIAIVLGKIFGLDIGTVAGMFAGSTTTSAALGTAEGAIRQLSLTPAQQTLYLGNVAVAYAITYIFGTAGTLLFLKLYPSIMRINLRKEAQALQASLNGGVSDDEGPGLFFWNNRIGLRSFKVTSQNISGKTVSAIEALLPKNMSVEKIKQGEDVITPKPDTVVNLNDEISIAGKESVLVGITGILGPETYDPSTDNVDGEILEVCVLNASIVGKTLADFAKRKEVHGVFLHKVTRQGRELPIAANLQVHKCDVLELVGAKSDVERVVKLLGYPERPTVATDLVLVGIGCVIGVLIGLLSVTLGGIPITLGVGGGILVAGLVLGWLRSRHPTFGQIPSAGLWILTDLGLNLFIACVGVGAGAKAISALETTGFSVFLCGIVVSILPLFLALLFGQFVLKMNPVLLLGSGAGARDTTAALISIQDDAGNSTPSLGFAAPYAFANVLLAVGGSLIVNIMAKI
ncbi:MAG: aspartate-alanine antiporter [Coprothermobacterota bacterium]|nr:aspartate-alanine antiporter [Coprothermobacterota bacterium]